MKGRKKFTALLLAAAVTLTMMPVQGFAADNNNGAGNVSINEKNFPDPVFRKIVRELPEGEDDVLTQKEIKGVITLFCDGTEKKIASLKGIEYFTSLENLFCFDNNLENVDLSKNRKLSYADFGRNKLTSLDVSKNGALESLDCRYNNLEKLNVSGNKQLAYLYCDGNKLKELDVTGNPAMQVLWCASNQLEKLDITKNRNMERVYAYHNHIVYIHTANNRYLQEIYYAPEKIEMTSREDFKYTKVDTFEEFLNEYSQYYDVKTSGLVLDRKAKTISLKGNNTSGKIMFKSGDDVEYQYTFYYDTEKKPADFNAELNSKFTKVNSTTYKYVREGIHVNAEPVVTDKNGNKLVKDKDYTVKYSEDRRANTGKYLITIQGKGDYQGTVTLKLVILPETVTEATVRHSTAEGGFDDAFLFWDRVYGADGYQIYARRPDHTSTWRYMGSTKDRTFLAKDLYDGRKYEFIILPYMHVDGTNYRNTENSKILSMITLKKVENLKAVKHSSKSVHLSWENIPGESGYQVKAARTGKTTYFKKTVTSMNVIVPKGKKYTYKVRAYKTVMKNGEAYTVYGPWSEEKTYTLK